MSKEGFRALCERLCAEHGWELLPSGLRLRIEGGRKQLVELVPFEHAGRDMVRLVSTIGPADRLEIEVLTDALLANAMLVHGALAIREGHLVMTETLIVDDTDESELAGAVNYLGERGDFFERTLFGADRH